MTETEWAPHVSFDDLAPTIIEDEVQEAKNDGYLVSLLHSPGKSKSQSLPPLPETSSLKLREPWNSTKDYDLTNMDWHDEREVERDTDFNTEKNSATGHGAAQGGVSHLPETGDSVGSPKRKSFAGMSDEDLAKLEDFYRSKSRSTQKPRMDKFDFQGRSCVILDNPPKNRGVQSAIVDPLTPTYPTRPVVTHRAISLTTQNPSFDKPRRTVSCYLSGRRHTWSAADWYVENESRDGDHLIIVTTISNFEKQIMKNNASRRNPKLTRSLSATDTSSISNHSGSLRSQPRVIHEEAKITCRNILNYYELRLKHKVIRITVEMVKEDSSKETITKTMALYKPDLQIISTVSTNIQARFRHRKVKLPNFIMRHYSIPLCIVPYEFVDPKLLNEDANTSSTDTQSSPQGRQKSLPPKNAQVRLQELDQIITKTLNNPFATKEEEPAGSDSSIHDYAPPSNEQERKRERFELQGYVRPRPSRPDACLGSVIVARDSGSPSTLTRTSRLYDTDASNGIPVHKIRSLVDTDYEHHNDDHHHRHPGKLTRPHLARSKSSTVAKIPSPSDRMPKSTNPYKKSVTSPASASSQNSNSHRKKKQKGTLGSLFKKVFG